MIEVTIHFDVSNGSSYETFTVNIEPDGYNTPTYRVAIVRALEEFERQQPYATISHVKTRRVPPKSTVLEVLWPK